MANTNLTEKQIDNRVEKIEELKIQIKELGDKKDSLIKEIQNYMDENDLEVVETKHSRITWPHFEKSDFRESEFKAEMPELYKKFVRMIPSRQFRSKKIC